MIYANSYFYPFTSPLFSSCFFTLSCVSNTFYIEIYDNISNILVPHPIQIPSFPLHNFIPLHEQHITLHIYQIKFDQPVTLLPHSQRGLYCHSSLPDDLGIQYQSYQSKESIVAENEVCLFKNLLK